jgi:hypothetical protein
MPEPIFMKLGTYIMPPDPISTAYFINPSDQSVCLYVYPLSLLDNGWVNTFPRHRIHATVEELLTGSFSVRSVSYEKRVCGSASVSPISVYVPPQRWSEDSQSRQTVKYDHEFRGTRN